MKTDDKELTENGPECKAKKALSSWEKIWLIIAALWLQVMVVVFVVTEIRHRDRTPITEWVNKMTHLLGM